MRRNISTRLLVVMRPAPSEIVFTLDVRRTPVRDRQVRSCVDVAKHCNCVEAFPRAEPTGAAVSAGMQAVAIGMHDKSI
eukprot:1181015-Prorocentrum_minimum.AAC.6